MMFCLRSFIPLLLLPLPPSLSPLYLVLLLTLTYTLNRPCIYCSFLLLILFASSCYWSDRCFVDLSHLPLGTGTGAGAGTTSTSLKAEDMRDLVGWWFEPRMFAQMSQGTSAGMLGRVNETAGMMLGAAMEKGKDMIMGGGGWTTGSAATMATGAGVDTGDIVSSPDVVGLGWLRSLLGRTEWTLPCVNVKIRL